MIDDGRLSAVLDWEHAHIGDPAEDLGYIRSCIGNQLDWPQFLAEYEQAGRPVPSPERVLFYEIWAHIRNAASSAAILPHFESGKLSHVRYGLLPYQFIPHFLNRAQVLIGQWNAN
jgi:aminoglycoside phosphotransferase (APT) family kinase protein